MGSVTRITTVGGWLSLAVLCMYLSGGDRPVELAVWIGPAILLRFMRETRPWIGTLVALPCMVGAGLLADRGMLPIPGRFLVMLNLIGSAYALLPYLADRLLRSSLPKGIKTLLFPSVAVAVPALWSTGTWGHFAYGIRNLEILQIASLAGMWGIVFLVYWAAAVLNEVWECRDRLRDSRGLMAVFLAVLLGVYGFGTWRLGHEKPTPVTLHVAGIVPGPGHRELMMEAFTEMASRGGNSEEDAGRLRDAMDGTFKEMIAESVRQASAGAKMVLWSEGAVVVMEADERAYIEQVMRIAREHSVYLGLGMGVLMDDAERRRAGGEPFIQNKLILVSPDGEIAWKYLKTNLAPGMERMWTIPGDGVLQSAEFPWGTVTGAICYDMDFPRHISQAGKMKSDLMLAPANDWAEIKNTHARMARLRAIENGVPVLRPSSGGVSTAIDAYGRVLSRVDYYQSKGAPLVAELPVGSVGTLYASLGDFWLWICSGGVVTMTLSGLVRWGAASRSARSRSAGEGSARAGASRRITGTGSER